MAACLHASTRRNRWAMVAALLLAGRSAAAQPRPYAPEGSPFHIYPTLDLPAIGGAAFLWTMPTLILHNQIHPPSCNPCDPLEVNAFDRWFIRFHNDKAGWASNALYGAPPIIWLVTELVDLGVKRPGAFFVDLAVLAEALAWSGALDEIFRHAVHRPRPYLYVQDLFPDRRVEAEATRSYYSGHTSAVVAFAVVTARTFELRNPTSRWRAPMWVMLMVLATAESMLRVWSGDHFPTDVFTGAAVGGALGVLVTEMHRRGPAVRVPGVGAVALVPSSGGGVTTLSLSGRF